LTSISCRPLSAATLNHPNRLPDGRSGNRRPSFTAANGCIGCPVWPDVEPRLSSFGNKPAFALHLARPTDGFRGCVERARSSSGLDTLKGARHPLQVGESRAAGELVWRLNVWVWATQRNLPNLRRGGLSKRAKGLGILRTAEGETGEQQQRGRRPGRPLCCARLDTHPRDLSRRTTETEDNKQTAADQDQVAPGGRGELRCKGPKTPNSNWAVRDWSVGWLWPEIVVVDSRRVAGKGLSSGFVCRRLADSLAREVASSWQHSTRWIS